MTVTQIPIESAFCNRLDQAEGPVVFVDATSGRVVGRFIPEPTTPLLRPEYGCADSEEEVRQAFAEAVANPGIGKPLAQIWKELGRTE
jgi:hypothetical protein